MKWRCGMTDGILLVLVGVVAAAVAAGLTVWWVRREDAEAGEVVDEALALVGRLLGEWMGEAEVRALAGWVYDWAGLSAYYGREDWVALVLRLWPGVERGLAAAPMGLRR